MANKAKIIFIFILFFFFCFFVVLFLWARASWCYKKSTNLKQKNLSTSSHQPKRGNNHIHRPYQKTSKKNRLNNIRNTLGRSVRGKEKKKLNQMKWRKNCNKSLSQSEAFMKHNLANIKIHTYIHTIHMYIHALNLVGFCSNRPGKPT